MILIFNRGKKKEELFVKLSLAIMTICHFLKKHFIFMEFLASSNLTKSLKKMKN